MVVRAFCAICMGFALDFMAFSPYLGDKKQNFMIQQEPSYNNDPRPFLLLLFSAMMAMFVALLCGCTTTRYVAVPETHTDTIRLVHEQHDSIWLHDSIYQREYMRGDTVYRYVDRWHNQYIKKLLRDTAYISRRDTVPVPYPVEKRVPAQLSWRHQARLWLANLVLVALAVAAAVWIARKRKWWLAIIRKLL